MKILMENLLKNFVIFVILVLIYPSTADFISNIHLSGDSVATNSIVMAVSITTVIACFGAFAFTYEKIDVKNIYHRALGHFTSSIFLLIIGICIILTDLLMTIILGRFILIDITLALLYLACVGFDFWDVLRIKEA